MAGFPQSKNRLYTQQGIFELILHMAMCEKKVYPNMPDFSKNT
jgi:hypothetical protein